MSAVHEDRLKPASELEGTPVARIECGQTSSDTAPDSLVIGQVEVEEGGRPHAAPVAAVQAVPMLEVQAEPNHLRAQAGHLEARL